MCETVSTLHTSRFGSDCLVRNGDSASACIAHLLGFLSDKKRILHEPQLDGSCIYIYIYIPGIYNIPVNLRLMFFALVLPVPVQNERPAL